MKPYFTSIVLLIFSTASPLWAQLITLKEAEQRIVTRFDSSSADITQSASPRVNTFAPAPTELLIHYGQFNSLENDLIFDISQPVALPVAMKKRKELNELEQEKAQLLEASRKNESLLNLRKLWTAIQFHRSEQLLLEELDSILSDLISDAPTLATDANIRYLKGLIAVEKIQVESHAEPLLLALTAELETDYTLRHFGGIQPMEPTSFAESTGNYADELEYVERKIAETQRELEAAENLPQFSLGYFNQSIKGPIWDGSIGAERELGFNDRLHGFTVGVNFPLLPGRETSVFRSMDLHLAENEDAPSSTSTLDRDIKQLDTVISIYANEVIPATKELLKSSMENLMNGGSSTPHFFQMARQYWDERSLSIQVVLEHNLLLLEGTQP